MHAPDPSKSQPWSVRTRVYCGCSVQRLACWVLQWWRPQCAHSWCMARARCMWGSQLQNSCPVASSMRPSDSGARRCGHLSWKALRLQQQGRVRQQRTQQHLRCVCMHLRLLPPPHLQRPVLLSHQATRSMPSSRTWCGCARSRSRSTATGYQARYLRSSVCARVAAQASCAAAGALSGCQHHSYQSNCARCGEGWSACKALAGAASTATAAAAGGAPPPPPPPAADAATAAGLPRAITGRVRGCAGDAAGAAPGHAARRRSSMVTLDCWSLSETECALYWRANYCLLLLAASRGKVTVLCRATSARLLAHQRYSSCRAHSRRRSCASSAL